MSLSSRRLLNAFSSMLAISAGFGLLVPSALAQTPTAPTAVTSALAAPPATTVKPEAEAVTQSRLARIAQRSLLLGLATSQNAIVAVGERGHVLRSTDQGQTWTQISVPTRALLTGIIARADGTMIAIGHDAVILVSRDAGQSWTIQYVNVEAESPLMDVAFVDGDTVLAVGAYGLVLRSSDAGQNWARLQPLPEGFDFHLNRIVRFADGRLLVAGEAGTLLGAAPGGEGEWQELTSPYPGSFFGALALDSNSALVYGLRGNLYRTDDGGASWNKIEVPTTAGLFTGYRAEDGRIFIAGSDGTLLTSTDQGQTFAIERRPDRLTLADLVLTADGAVLIASDAGVLRAKAGDSPIKAAILPLPGEAPRETAASAAAKGATAPPASATPVESSARGPS